MGHRFRSPTVRIAVLAQFLDAFAADVPAAALAAVAVHQHARRAILTLPTGIQIIDTARALPDAIQPVKASTRQPIRLTAFANRSGVTLIDG